MEKKISYGNIITIAVLAGSLLLHAGWFQKDLEYTTNLAVENRTRIESLEQKMTDITWELKELNKTTRIQNQMLAKIASSLGVEIYFEE